MIETSGHDRLLAAAEWLDKRGHRGEEPDRASESWAEAALLRAVAAHRRIVEQHSVAAHRLTRKRAGRWYCDCAVCAAALDLADTILGVGDE